jgi:hypothetical protein
MTRRVTAVFPDRADAERAADALMDLGAARHEISLLSRHGDEPVAAERHDSIIEPAREVGDDGAPLTTTDEQSTAEGAATGAAVGAAVGLAAGAAMLLVPGFGLVLAAGPLAWALGGAAGAAAAGAVAGGVYGALQDLGVEETTARGYEERLREGGMLLSARVPMLPEEQIRAVLVEHGAEDVHFAAPPASGGYPAAATLEEEIEPAVPAPTTFPPADPAVGPTMPPSPAGTAPMPPPPVHERTDDAWAEEEEEEQEQERTPGRRF